MIGPAISDGAWYAVASPEPTEPPDEAISQVLAEFQGRAPIPKEAQRFFPMGDPAASITDAAPEWTADLVVIGSPGRECAERVLLGSVARQAPSPVLIVRKYDMRALRPSTS